MKKPDWMGWIGWTRDRIRHIRNKHRVDPEELHDAYVANQPHVVYRRSKHGRFGMYSQTSSGRYVTAFASLEYGDGRPGLQKYDLIDSDSTPGEGGMPLKGKGGAYIWTARDMTDAERKWYREMLGR